MKYLILLISLSVFADDWQYDIEPAKKAEDSHHYDPVHKERRNFYNEPTFEDYC